MDRRESKLLPKIQKITYQSIADILRVSQE